MSSPKQLAKNTTEIFNRDAHRARTENAAFRRTASPNSESGRTPNDQDRTNAKTDAGGKCGDDPRFGGSTCRETPKSVKIAIFQPAPTIKYPSTSPIATRGRVWYDLRVSMALSPKQPHRARPVKKSKMKRRRCLNDHKLFQPKLRNQKFCCDPCRKEFHRYGSSYGPLRTGLHRAIDQKYSSLKKDLLDCLARLETRLLLVERVQADAKPQAG